MVLELLLVGLTSGLPNVPPERICKNAGSLVAASDRGRAYDSCVIDERNALATLKEQWGSLPADIRSTCGAGIGGLPSYVDILTCVELRPGGNLNSTPNIQFHGR